MPKDKITEDLLEHWHSLGGLFVGLTAIALAFFSPITTTEAFHPWVWVVNFVGAGAILMGIMGFMNKNNRFICTFAIATGLAAISMQYSWIAFIIVVLLTVLSVSF